MRLHCIGCQVLSRELRAAAAHTPHSVDFEFLPMSLHEGESSALRDRLQGSIDRVDAARVDAILVGYGLCGYALDGLTPRHVQLVVPCVHDCIGVLFGGERKLREYLTSNPGTYFRSSGWMEHPRRLATDTWSDVGRSFDEFAARYGEDNAKHLFEILGRPTRHYSRLAYVRTGTGVDAAFERQAQEEAGRHGWAFDPVEGDPSIIRRFLGGDWGGGDFLVVPPGRRVVATHDERVIDAVPAVDPV